MVSLVICTYNREKYLPKVLNSIKAQDSDKYEIILINNNCTDSTEDICTDFKNNNPDIIFHYYLETKQGLSHARNRGFEESNYELIAYLDDDAFITKNYVSEIISSFQKNDIDALGGKILLDYESFPPKWENIYINSLFGYYDMGDKEFFYKKSYPRGSNMVFRKTILKLVNGFNPNLGRVGGNMNGGEEKDIFNKVYGHNKKVFYNPNLIVHHTVPPARTTLSFIKNQAIGIGYAEKIRTTNISFWAYLFRVLLEMYKWGGTLGLFIIYFFTSKVNKGLVLLKFRYWVSRGLLIKKI